MEPEFLSTQPLLDALSLETLASIAQQLSRKRVSAGEFVFQCGDPPDDMYILHRGVAEVVIDVDGHDVILSELNAPTFFGGMSVFEQVPRCSAIRARSDIDLIAIPSKVIQSLDEGDSAEQCDFYRRAFVVTSRRLRTANLEITKYFRRQLEEEKEATVEQEFNQLLVHDLRSPLLICDAGVRQLLEKQKKYGRLSKMQERILRRSHRSAVFLSQLINELLEVGRSRVVDERAEQTTLRTILVEAIPQSLGGVRSPNLDDVSDLNKLEPILHALKRDDFFVEVARPLLDIPFLVDRVRLLQVIMNLVSNALKHAPGWLTLRIEQVGDQCSFAVIDRGPSIPSEYRQGVFELYRQAHIKREGVRRGFGLGLAGAARLVASIGGSIRAESGPGGVGNMISFDIPFRKKA